MDTFTEMLDRQLETEIQSLSTMEPESEEKAKTVDNLTKLHKLKMDERRTKAEKYEKAFDVVVKIGGVVSTVGLAYVGYRFKERWYTEGFHFEKEGKLLSDTFREIRRMDPLKG